MKKTTLTTLFVGLLSMSSAFASPFTISMVADNDFAVFSGTSSSINSLLYQNDVTWTQQISELSTLNFTLGSGDDQFYVLAMGGGGSQENISGTVNGVNIADPSVDVLMSSDIRSSLSNYVLWGNVANGTYNADLAEVQAGFDDATWIDPVLNSTQTVISSAGFGSGFTFSTGEARLFSFNAADVGVEPVNEPSIVALLGLGLIGIGFARRRKA